MPSPPLGWQRYEEPGTDHGYFTVQTANRGYPNEVDIASGIDHIVNGNIECDRGSAVDADDWDGDPSVLKESLLFWNPFWVCFLLVAGYLQLSLLGL